MKYLSLAIIALLIGLGLKAQTQPTLVEIATDSGRIVIQLYDQTSLHKQNFLKVIKDGYYNNAIFHRIIKDFMIQAGESKDPKAATKYKELIPNEIVDTIYNVRGAVCAARTADQVNPERKSSPVQFYIVQGKRLSNNQLNSVENNINNANINLYAQKIYKHLSDSLKKGSPGIADTTVQRMTIERAQASFVPYKFTQKQRELYTTIGGAPHLDSQYTVFGQVVEGMDVVDKLAGVPTGQANKPLKDIRMKVKVIK